MQLSSWLCEALPQCLLKSDIVISKFFYNKNNNNDDDDDTRHYSTINNFDFKRANQKVLKSASKYVHTFAYQ